MENHLLAAEATTLKKYYASAYKSARRETFVFTKFHRRLQQLSLI